MAHLVWTADLDTGIAEIDRQHQRIAQYINTVYDLCSSPDRAALQNVIADTVDYTASHFAFEESLLEEAGYDFLGPHKKVHELFVRRVVGIQERFNAGEDVAEELHRVLSRWLFSHIRTEDHAYAGQVKKHLQRTHSARAQQLSRADYEEMMPELNQRLRSKGWLARLFGR